jgi:hypothetical protein
MRVDSRHAQQRTTPLERRTHERGTGACQVEQRGQISVTFQARRRAAQSAAWIAGRPAVCPQAGPWWTCLSTKGVIVAETSALDTRRRESQSSCVDADGA